MKSAKVREKFLEYFRGKDHEIAPSAPLVIKDDPTLMFTNAGMNQFKDLFLGNAAIKHPRVADTQKCLRVSGKHNDLEEVGIDTYHHTLFEMLGNWSFGNYFKKEAIKWAWELLTGVYKISPDRLYVTVFEGSKEDNIAFDQESADTWKKYINPSRIINGNKKDNFWEMGDTGPCGPCSEVHVDLRDEREREKVDGKTLVNTGNPEVIEIWNLVFMEFNRKANGVLEKLPARHVDTGMGFERLCMALQDKKSTYDTDVFQPIIRKIEDLCGLRYKPEDRNKQAEITNIGIRVIADHIRAISFAIADGQLPSNTGAGYVIRRILRRAVRYGYQSLGIKEPFLHRLVPVLANQMGEFFPEIEKEKLFVQKVVKEEETSFFHTLEQGLKKIDAVCISVSNSKTNKVVDGKVVFELYDTYGFPVDLTSLIARQYGLSIEEDGFNEEMTKQKSRSKDDAKVDTADWITPHTQRGGLGAATLSPLGRGGEGSAFVGYDSLEAISKIVKYRKVKTKGKELYQIILNQTPFYAESGGQVGDTGILESGSEKIIITDTKKENNLIVHFSETLPKNLSVEFKASVDSRKRLLTMNNHTATHLLHAALRHVLGKQVEQKGSLVNEEHLRFDFSHFSKVTEGELAKIEARVNEKIRENIKSDIQEMPIEQAKKLGAMALFGEKYGDTVRVVTFPADRQSGGDKNYSIELCGGTHVPATGQIGYFKITSESAVAAGIRRIEAVTAIKAEELINDQTGTLNQLKDLLKQPKDLIKNIQELQMQNTALSKQVASLLNEKAKFLQTELISKIQKQNGINFIAEKIELNSSEAIKNLSFELKNKIENLFLVLGASVNSKPILTVMLSDNLVKDKKLHAGNIVKELAKEINGGGGGQPFYATAGGSNPEGLNKAIESAKKFVV
ncbi:MAG: alanine--tRNA ligase [Bacteroidetes bacterium]|nr:MAG: alanine--tRNA ligase [Bacteroidota bacterium]